MGSFAKILFFVFLSILFFFEDGPVCIQKGLKCRLCIGITHVVNAVLQSAGVIGGAAHRGHLHAVLTGHILSRHLLTLRTAHRGHLHAVLAGHILSHHLLTLGAAHWGHLHAVVTRSLCKCTGERDCGNGTDQSAQYNTFHRFKSFHNFFSFLFHRFFYPVTIYKRRLN